MAKHVMIDLETLSTAKDAAIIQLAAVAFDAETGLVSGDPLFSVFVRELAGRVDVDTVAWWMQQSAAPRIGQAIVRDGLSLRDALSRFGAWFAELGPVDGVWSHGASFDLPVLETALRACGLDKPWSYRAERDTRTLYALAPGGIPAVEIDETRKHDALYDCELQVQQVCGALKALRRQADDAEERGEA